MKYSVHKVIGGLLGHFTIRRAACWCTLLMLLPGQFRIKSAACWFALLMLLSACAHRITQREQGWPDAGVTARPWTRWWWPGNDVDTQNLTWNLEEMQKAGFGGTEITPIYGVQGRDSSEIKFLSPRWMDMYRYTIQAGDSLGLKTDLNNGTGWPFGGPNIKIEDAAVKALFHTYTVDYGKQLEGKITAAINNGKQVEKKIMAGSFAPAALSVVMAYGPAGQHLDITASLLPDGTLRWTPPAAGSWEVIAVFNGKTMQAVKRAAPGGEGLVMNHFSKHALAAYLSRFDSAFSVAGAPYPHTFFNDSYEVYGADWSENMFAEFEQRRGYKLGNYLPELLRQRDDSELCARVVADYRETMSDMLLHNFTEPWNQWVHSKGSITRNQAHGSPGNVIDLYAASDIPECEAWSTWFDIPGLRYDSGTTPQQPYIAGLKYASSAAHLTGKTYTSSETFTWITEHFRTSLSQCKPMLDMLFVSGVNHIYFHGTPYTPKDSRWPGWLFYASVNFSPFNTIWRDLKSMNEYITRCQSFLQFGQPDNELLVYFPMYDVWHKEAGLFYPFEISKKLSPSFDSTVAAIAAGGYDADYITDRFISKATVENGRIVLPGGKYKTLVIPRCKLMPPATMGKLIRLAKEGASIAFLDNLPSDVPGLHQLADRRQQLHGLTEQLPAPARNFSLTKQTRFYKGNIITGTNIDSLLLFTGATVEKAKTRFNIDYIRRQYDGGHIYFMTMLHNKSINDWVPLGVKANAVMRFNPLTGEYGKVAIRHQDGKTAVLLQLLPGESVILKTFSDKEITAPVFPLFQQQGQALTLSGNWKFRFTDGEPLIKGEYDMPGNPVSWTTLPIAAADAYAGTGRYTLTFTLPQSADEWELDFGSLAESAHVFINGQDAGTVWSIPYRMRVGKFLQPGSNTIEIDVTNLPFNRIRYFDQQGIKWRIFKDINIVNMSYKSASYASWPIAPSGLIQPVKLRPLVVNR